MRRRIFLAGTLAAGTAAALWRARGGWPGVAAGGAEDGELLPDGRRFLVEAGLAFGTTVSVAAVHADPRVARPALRAALDAVRGIDALMTVYRPSSQVGRLNAGGALDDPDPRLVEVLAFAQRLSALSDGAFDVTVQPLWRCHEAARREGRVPTADELAAARALVGWEALTVSPARVAFARPGMSLTLNGVAQGYGADQALAVLRRHGVEDALVDAGEHGAAGARQPGRPWTVGVQDPRDPAALLGAVAMDGRFLAVSADDATTFTADRSAHHVFDPRTGRSPPGLSLVAVAAATGLEADGLTKPMMVLDLPAARRLLARFPGAGAAWADKAGRLVAATGLALEGA